MTDFAPGQRWIYRTRPGEETSTVLILRCEDWPSDTVIHVYLDGLRLRNPHLPGGVQDTLSHTPVREDAVRASVTELIEERAALPHDGGGYETWRTAFERGEAGVFTLPLADIVEALEVAVNGPRTGDQPDVFRKSHHR